jgi:hypothetical protein
MEQIIARLSKDFEHGKMTRRQLIQNLALTPTAASAATVRSSVAAGGGFKAIAVNQPVRRRITVVRLPTGPPPS